MHYIDGNGTEVATMYVPANTSIVNYSPEVIPSKSDLSLALE
jgi:hypothetical protein